MKKAIIITVIVIVSIGVLLTGTGLILTKGDFSKAFQADIRTQKFIDETQTVTSLKLSISADNVEFYPSTDNLLHIDYWDSENRPFVYTYINGEAELKQTANYISWFSIGNYVDKTVKVYVPASLSESLTVSLSSGNLKNFGSVINVETININMSSGNVIFDNITAQNFYVHMSSGYFNLADSQINTLLDLKLSSGGVNLEDCYIKSLKTVISSGDISSIGLETTSINMVTSSGDVNLHLNGEAQDYTMNMITSSGNISIEGTGASIKAQDQLQWGDGEYDIYCRSSSGDIRIYFD